VVAGLGKISNETSFEFSSTANLVYEFTLISSMNNALPCVPDVAVNLTKSFCF